ncbi:MAG: hypothetical protein A2190_09000 [Lysobacterales bacterium RIFOXYA1_FULL_69_10]|nr:MAG: hypothetical protein A2190_09000 [Xanthomonadales bacterium RIFOXYA1_FULL_69_10]
MSEALAREATALGATLSVVAQEDVLNHWPMIERWAESYRDTPDAEAGGKTFGPEAILDLIREGAAELVVLSLGSKPVGCAAHVLADDYLEGVMLWIEASHRRRGLLRGFFGQLMPIVRERGLRGVRFSSKGWDHDGLKQLGFRCVREFQDAGATVRTWVMEE